MGLERKVAAGLFHTDRFNPIDKSIGPVNIGEVIRDDDVVETQN
jgi:hypothetical protein